ncbi:MAG TPA: bifunctional phosphoribosyl-AMP cyclohydrolase/phosphoribosyl-ATP diphosphatase HisIE [Steroidobacteraceae bacterium]|nr:bifunctional phosphoribosyl-AMP cyclohydrolase/phosphoribosyl-ATP diphosphatase HisIE [Steroidobacteraceae bacterium]
MNEADVATLDWSKTQGLIPAIVQHADTGTVLMLGYMDRAALAATLATKRVTFFSRTRQRQWTKGESSGNYILVEAVTPDCDRDTLLVLGRPAGPVCHTGAPDCFHGQPASLATELAFLHRLESIIGARIAEAPEGSYTAKLHAKGPSRIAQKVGEEGLEVALAAVQADDQAVIGESADLLYHLLVLLKSRGQSLEDVVRELASRHAARA